MLFGWMVCSNLKGEGTTESYTQVILLVFKKSQTTTWDVKNPVNNGINDQPQLAIAGFQPSTSMIEDD